MASHESIVDIFSRAAGLFLELAGNEIRDLDFNKKENIGRLEVLRREQGLEFLNQKKLSGNQFPS